MKKLLLSALFSVSLLNATQQRKFWTHEEDQRLTYFVYWYGTHKWSEIAGQIPGRNGRQCRQRWINFLDPNVNHSKWTDEEDLLLIRQYKELGSKWPKIKNFFKNRTDSQLKARYSHLVRNGSIERISDFCSSAIIDILHDFRINNLLNNK